MTSLHAANRVVLGIDQRVNNLIFCTAIYSDITGDGRINPIPQAEDLLPRIRVARQVADVELLDSRERLPNADCAVEHCLLDYALQDRQKLPAASRVGGHARG